jgi:putative NADH-flavin reductase
MNVVICGASGPTGRLLTRQLLDEGHIVVAVTRWPEDFPIADPALTVVGSDVHENAAVGA